MDAKNILSDLLALKRLYGLLKKDGDGTSYAASDLLDEHARLLLKYLLDAETKRVLRLHPKIIAGQVEASSTPSPSPLTKMPIATDNNQNRKKVQKLDGLDLTLWRENRLFSPQLSRADSLEQQSVRKKRCRVCQQYTVEQLQSMTHFDDDDDESDCCPKNSKQEAGLFLGNNKTGLVEATTKPEELDWLSKEASEAIKRIDLSIASDRLHLSEKHGAVRRVKSEENFMTPEEINQPYLSNSRGPALESDASNKVKRIHGQNVKAIIDKIESGNWTSRRDNFLLPGKMIDGVQNYSALKRVHNEVFYTTPSLQSRMESPYQSHTAMDNEHTRHGHFQTYNMSRGKNHPLKIMGEPPLNKNVIRKNRGHALEQLQESEGTDNTDSYSNWTSKQSSSRYSDSGEYSSPGESQSTTSSQIRASPSQSQGYNCYTSNSVDEFYSSTSGDDQVTSSSSKSEGYSSCDKPVREPTSKKSGPTLKKQSGMWKRMKDRLAIIFHHHHHHHHHHHYNGDDESLNERNEKFVNRKRHENEAYGERAVEKTRKAMIHEKDQQKGKFVGGILKHIRRSKELKPEKDNGVGQLAKHGRKKALKKSHWWQLLQHHRRAKKTQAKLGLGKKKGRLKALPKIK